MRPRYRRDAAEISPRYGQSVAEISPRSRRDLAEMRPGLHLMRSMLVEGEPLQLDYQHRRQGEKETLALRGDADALESEPRGDKRRGMTRGRSEVRRRWMTRGRSEVRRRWMTRGRSEVKRRWMTRGHVKEVKGDTWTRRKGRSGPFELLGLTRGHVI